MEATIKKQEPSNQEELLELRASLTKKLETKDYESLQSILKVVMSKQVTYQHLKDTKIGSTVSTIKDLPATDSEASDAISKVKNIAEKIIKEWKELRDKEKQQGKSAQKKDA